MAPVSEPYKTTIIHDEIEKWAEARGGSPAMVEGRIIVLFPGEHPDGKVEKISWKMFFIRFEEEKLAFVYEDDPDSRFHQFAPRKEADVRAERSVTKETLAEEV